MFLIEDLQPSWLSGRSQRWAYVCGVSVVGGLLLGLVNTIYWTPLGEPESNPVVWCTVIPLWLLMLGCVDNLKFGPGSAAVDRLQPGFRRAVAKMLASAACWLLLVAMLWPFVDQVLRVHLLWAGVVMVTWVGAKGANRSMYYCIEPVESLEWSLTWARQGMVLGLLSGLAVGGVVFVLPRDLRTQIQQEWIIFLGWGAMGLGVGGLLGGLRTRTFKGKTFPNQGIRLSLKTAVFVGLNAVWLVTIAMALVFAGRFDNPFKYLFGLLAVFFAILFFWFGGAEVLKHYVLRTVLGVSGQLPFNLPRFLNYARDLNLLQRVGSAYIFVHRRLLEHMAASGGTMRQTADRVGSWH
jgi:hypothetical protein